MEKERRNIKKQIKRKKIAKEKFKSKIKMTKGSEMDRDEREEKERKVISIIKRSKMVYIWSQILTG